MRRKFSKKLFLVIFLVLLMSVASSTLISLKLFSFMNFVDIVSVIITVISVFCLFAEMNASRRIAESEFISNLNNTFVENEDYKRIYTMLDSYEGGDLDLDNASISNYLTFFEVFWILKEKNTISFSIFDDLFGYRFFIAVHNPYIQKKKIVKVPRNFKNIYKLEREWIDYRTKLGKDTYGMEYSLDKMVDPDTYKEMIK